MSDSKKSEHDYNLPPLTDRELACYFGKLAIVFINDPERAGQWAAIAGHYGLLALAIDALSKL